MAKLVAAVKPVERPLGTLRGTVLYMAPDFDAPLEDFKEPLLDAHTLIWALDDPSRLGPQAIIGLKNTANQLLLSAGTLWELAIKVGQKKLSLSLPYRQWMAKAIADLPMKTIEDELGKGRHKG